MLTRAGLRLAIALIGSTVTLLAAVPASATAPAQQRQASVAAGRLVLEPTDRGYQGTLPITVTNLGDEARSFMVGIAEPVAGGIGALVPDSPCLFDYRDGRRLYDCQIPRVEPGKQRTVEFTFRALVTPRPYPMIVPSSLVGVRPGESLEFSDQTTYATLFRSTSGSLRHPRPYVQSTRADAGITSAPSVQLIRQANGTFRGRLPVTVRYGTDAGHDYLTVTAANLPAGVMIFDTDPPYYPTAPDWFNVPGERLMPNEARTFHVLLQAAPETPVGPLGTVTFDISTEWANTTVPERSPADNTTSFSVTTVEAG